MLLRGCRNGPNGSTSAPYPAHRGASTRRARFPLTPEVTSPRSRGRGPLALRLAAAATVLLMTAAISLWQPAGRSLEDWAFVLLRYISIPRVVVWRVRTSRELASPEEARFEVLLPEASARNRRTSLSTGGVAA